MGQICLLRQGRQACAWEVGWIPPGVAHAAAAAWPVSGSIVYLRPDLCAALPQSALVLKPGNVLNAVLDKICGWGEVPAALSGPQQRLLALLIDELAGTQGAC